MKRVHLQQENPVPYSNQEAADSPSAQSDVAPLGAKRRARTSAAMIGLALSMGATSLLLPRQDDGAVAAEPKLPDTSMSAALPHSSASQPEAQPSGTAQFPTVRLVEHVVQEGQTFQQLASQYQVNVWSIALANRLSPDAVLEPGQTLKIPVPANSTTEAQTSANPLVASADLNQLPTVASGQAEASQRADRSSALDRLRQQRDKLRDSLAELRSEDTLAAASDNETELTASETESAAIESSIQPSNHAEIANALAALPTLPSSEPQPAENQAPASAPLAASTAGQVAMRSTQPQVDATGIQTYRVNPGDTLARIAQSYNIPQSLLINANHLSNPNVIFVGQVLTVPAVQPVNPQPAVAVASEQLSPGVLPATAPIGNAGSPSVQGNQLTAVSSSIQPAPVSSAAPTLVAQSAQAPSAASNSADSTQSAASAPIVTRQVAVAPVSGNVNSVPTTPAVNPNSEAVDADLSSRFNPYVANLLSEFRELRQRNQPVAAAAVQSATPLTPAVASSNTTGELAVAPHFNESISRNADTLPVSNPVSSPTAASSNSASQPDLVAAAPLGSESYDPLLQPVTGRLVSPDLPPLPGADSFLPEDGLFNGYIWPARGMLTSGYGWRWGRMHQGIDIAADVGTPIHAAANGTVEFAGWNSGGYGNMVEIRHADGSMTRYAHMNAIYVEAGQRVDQGDQIGEMGSTGYSTGPHLHFEVHLPNQGTVNPMAYLPNDQTAQR